MAAKSWGTKHPDEDFTYGWDYADKLDTGDSLTGTPTITVSVIYGTDASPSSILSGAPSINGTVVSQKIIDGVDGVRYAVYSLVDTVNGEKLMGCAVLHVTSSC